ncbi:hypothetical protein GMO_06330 [Gluconobacter morbifer G707]|uniref:Uncharacterized protein n=1 Tax=Gluconobacter morbifer G707 TaxID=1088869 RepID=G6XGL8_9PROT|nr:hypothetical protein GMO_06330 [Gluconobacter morbifer G707]
MSRRKEYSDGANTPDRFSSPDDLAGAAGPALRTFGCYVLIQGRNTQYAHVANS